MMINSLHAHQINDWFIDNGVMHHMTNKRKLFHNFKEILEQFWLIEATFINGWVTCKGDIHIIVSRNE
jgi:type IV secretory pathway VirD2 relaxase